MDLHPVDDVPEDGYGDGTGVVTSVFGTEFVELRLPVTPGVLLQDST